jgi:catechol 2,3-dioxygenase-like lactoylglutathione lyase family enzyme
MALRVSDLEGSIRFYRSLFGVEPAKRRPGYATFAITEPPLKLVLLEGPGLRHRRPDHHGTGEAAGTSGEDSTCCGRSSRAASVRGG